MPRDPDNNPTDRIIRLIDEYSSCVEYIEYLLSFFPPAQRALLGERPSIIELEKEKLRQHLTKPHSVVQRDYRRRMRMLAKDHDLPKGVQSRKGVQQELARQLGEELQLPTPRTRRSIVDENKELSAEDQALVDMLKNSNLTFTKE